MRIRGATILWLGALLLGAGLFLAPPASGGGPDWVVLRRHDTGMNVRAAQALLHHRGYDVAVDGQFGWKTEQVVTRFQGDRGLTKTGVVDAATWPKLLLAFHEGDQGQCVRVIQRMLRRIYEIDVDGVFGSQTESVVKRFQSDAGLVVDGVVGKFTWKHLIAFSLPACIAGRCG
jgi:peptidoglycan hydrolase-like protein with peptidoglycan-binding domain